MAQLKLSINRLTFRYVSIILFICILSSCANERTKILKQADFVMESRPDSAMILLEGIDRSNLTETELPYYALLYTQAQVKTDIPLDSDSLIRIAYSKYGDEFKDDRGLRANFYTGEVFFNQGKNPEAMHYFLTVYEESKRLNNDYWHAKAAERISDLFYFAYNYDEAEKYAREAAQLFKSVGRQTFFKYTLGKLAIVFLNNRKDHQAYLLLDSLHRISLNEHPVDSLFLDFISLPLIDASNATNVKVNHTERKNLESALDSSILQSQFIDDAKKDEVTKSLPTHADTSCLSNDEKLHVLYALYKSAEAIGDNTLALSYVDSMLILQSIVTENVIKESVTGAQRDFYSRKSIWQEKKNSLLSIMLLIVAIVFIIMAILVAIIISLRHKSYHEKITSYMDTIASLKSSSDVLTKEKNILEKSIKEKEINIEELDNLIELSQLKIASLNQEIHSKNSEHSRLQELIDEKHLETESLKNLLIKKDSERKMIEAYLNDKITKENSDAHIIEMLFKEKWNTLDLLCSQYFSRNNSEISDKILMANIEKELKRIVSKKGLTEIVDAVDTYMGGVITLLREECAFLKEDDINYIALVYSGFSVKAVCLFLNLKYQHFYVKKSRLMKRIQDSDTPNKNLFLSKFK